MLTMCVCGNPMNLDVGHNPRKLTYKGVQLLIPNSFELNNACEFCGEFSLNKEEAIRLDAVLEPIYQQEKARHLEALRFELRKTGISMKDLEKAVGVPRTRLSHVFNNPQEADLTLITLLEMFILSPHEMRKRVETPVFDPSRLTSG